MYNEYTHFSETTAGDILTRAAAFGIPGEAVDGQDVRAVYATAQRIVHRSRAGQGPAFLLCNTYRYHGHHVGDINREYYRSKQEEKEWMSDRDPIKLFVSWLLSNQEADRETLKKIEDETRAEMKSAVQFALASPYPDASEVEQDVYA
jgi:pyruvate dehydrogenase E1 component alpha subunit